MQTYEILMRDGGIDWEKRDSGFGVRDSGFEIENTNDFVNCFVYINITRPESRISNLVSSI